MQEFNTYHLIIVGLAIRLLRQADSSFSLEIILNTADQLKAGLESSGFKVSLQGFVILERFLQPFKDIPHNQDRNAPLSPEQRNNLKGIMDRFENTVFSEAMSKNVYSLSGERFNLDTLMNNPEKMFADDIYDALSEIAKYDISEAFKCLVFSRPTASAFHILRATEEVLKRLYLLLVKTKREKKPMWGNMTMGIKDKKNLKDTGIIEQLDHIRIIYRNPTDHPEATYTDSEANDLLGLCIALINKMQKIQQKKGTA